MDTKKTAFGEEAEKKTIDKINQAIMHVVHQFSMDIGTPLEYRLQNDTYGNFENNTQVFTLPDYVRIKVRNLIDELHYELAQQRKNVLLLKESQDYWKQRALEAEQAAKKWQEEARLMNGNRDFWRERAETAEKEISQKNMLDLTKEKLPETFIHSIS